jgi:hypothetical protein
MHVQVPATVVLDAVAAYVAAAMALCNHYRNDVTVVSVCVWLRTGAGCCGA